MLLHFPVNSTKLQFVFFLGIDLATRPHWREEQPVLLFAGSAHTRSLPIKAQRNAQAGDDDNEVEEAAAVPEEAPEEALEEGIIDNDEDGDEDEKEDEEKEEDPMTALAKNET